MDIEEYRQIIRLADWDFITLTISIKPGRCFKSKFKTLPSINTYDEFLFCEDNEGKHKVIMLRLKRLLKAFNKDIKEAFP